MNRRILSLSFLLFVTMVSMAQDLIGTWKMSGLNSSESPSSALYLIYNNDGAVLCRLIVSNKSDVGRFAYDISLPGKYVRNGNTLEMLFNKEKVSVKVCDVVFSEEIKLLMEQEPNIKDEIMDVLEKSADGIKVETVSGLGLDGISDIVDLSDEVLELRLESDPGTILFSRVLNW